MSLSKKAFKLGATEFGISRVKGKRFYMFATTTKSLHNVILVQLLGRRMLTTEISKKERLGMLGIQKFKTNTVSM